MLSAWLIFAPVAIVSARLLKPEKAEWLGTRAWFWLHRTCNSLCVFCVVAGLVCIFVAMGGQWLATVEVGQQVGQKHLIHI
jgi:hypothetical protein